MLDLDDLLISDDLLPAAAAAPVIEPPGEGEGASPLRAWSMWGGWSAIGLVCAARVASAVSRVGRAVAGR